MDISRQTAEELSLRFKAASESCESSLREVMAHQSLGEVRVYGALVANFMGNVYTNVLRPIWHAFPDLEPAAMKEPYVEPVVELSPEAKAALQSFANDASTALSYAQQMVPHSSHGSTFALDGLPAIEEALHAIEAFAEQPRFR